MAIRRLAPIVGFALLALGSLAQAVEARDCRDETPLPADVRVIAPGADVPPDAARFSRAWVGPWKEATGDGFCGAPVVEEVLSTGHARVVASRGTWQPMGYLHPQYWRATGRVVDSELRFVHLWDMVAREMLEPIGAFHYRTAEGLEFHAVDRWTVTKARRVSTP